MNHLMGLLRALDLKHEETKLQHEGALLDQLEKMTIHTFVNRAIRQILLTFLK